ncbi:hypothetical protein Aperf_G00000122452 [Anoplocephala perfoliata]
MEVNTSSEATPIAFAAFGGVESEQIFIVSEREPCRLKCVDLRSGRIAIEYVHTNKILAIARNKYRVAACLNNRIYLHDLNNLEVISQVNVDCRGVFALAAFPDCMVAYSDSKNVGHVVLIDTMTVPDERGPERPGSYAFPAHEEPLSKIAFSSKSSLLASASESGKIIRIFSIPTGERLVELRGEISSTTCFSLNFTHDDKYLTSTSDTETIHVYKLDIPNQRRTSAPMLGGSNIEREVSVKSAAAKDENMGWTENISRKAEDTVGYTTGTVKDAASALVQEESFAQARVSDIMTGSRRCKAATVFIIEGECIIIAAGDEGFIRIFKFDPEIGGKAEHLSTTR